MLAHSNRPVLHKGITSENCKSVCLKQMLYNVRLLFKKIEIKIGNYRKLGDKVSLVVIKIAYACFHNLFLCSVKEENKTATVWGYYFSPQ